MRKIKRRFLQKIFIRYFYYAELLNYSSNFVGFQLTIRLHEAQYAIRNTVRGSALKGIENREQRIRISTYQKSCIVEYTVSDRLKFLFSIPCSFYCAENLIINN